jgi:Phage integrase, N-terminal SAM-like domain
MTPLRQRLIDDLRLPNYAPRTISTSVAAVVRFARHFGRSPDQLGAAHVRQYQLHLLEQRASWCRFNQTVAARRFFYGTTLGRPEVVTVIPYGKKPKSLPAVLSPDEVRRLFAAATRPRDRLLLPTAYAGGLRLAEVSACGSRTSTPGACCCTSAPPRAARTGWYRCRRCCWTCCAATGGSIAPAAGSSPARRRRATSAGARCSGSAGKPYGRPASPRRPAGTRSGIAMPPTFGSRAWT